MTEHHNFDINDDADLDLIEDRYTLIDAVLKEVIAKAPIQPSWADSWKDSTRVCQLTELSEFKANAEQRLAVFQQVQKSKEDLPGTAAFYLVASQIEFIAEFRIEDVVKELDNEVEGLFAKHEMERWCCNELKDFDISDFVEAYPETWERSLCKTFLEKGEAAMADVYRANRKHYELLMEEGSHVFGIEREPSSLT